MKNFLVQSLSFKATDVSLCICILVRVAIAILLMFFMIVGWELFAENWLEGEFLGQFMKFESIIETTVIGSIVIFLYSLYGYQSGRARRNLAKEIKEKSIYFSTVMKHVGDAVVIIDGKGIIQYFNDAATEIFGYHYKEARGQNVTILMPEDLARKHYAHLGKYDDTKPSLIGQGTVEVIGKRKDTTTFPIEMTLSTFQIEDERLFIGTIRDITIRKVKEKESEQLVEYWYEAQRNAVTASEKAAAADRVKSEFLANMSHELRTPLNAINGFSELIMAGTITNPEKIVEYAGDINSSGEHLLSIINDILDLSKVESGSMDLKIVETNLKAIIDTCIKLVGERVMKNRNTITDSIDDEVMVVADVLRLKQVILNLLTNAAKFTHGGSISIHCEQTDDYTNILVTDTGIGMDKDGLKKALSKFGQVDGSMTRTQEGTGLGLPLSKELVKSQNGKLTIESELGVGTVVKVSLPRTIMS